jgi:predicted nicotinamide N-methyase
LTDVALETTAELEASLRRRFRVVETTFAIGGRSIALLHPATADELIDEDAYERDERMPYWADIWPSSRALGGYLLAMPGDGQTFLELGGGCGLVSICAALAGFDVTPTDYEADALAFMRVNAARNGAVIRLPRLLDWRAIPADAGRYDVIVAADVLYEPRSVAPVASAIATLLRRGGLGLVADPGRMVRDEFVDAICDLGHTADLKTVLPYVDGSVEQRITIIRIATRT